MINMDSVKHLHIKYVVSNLTLEFPGTITYVHDEKLYAPFVTNIEQKVAIRLNSINNYPCYEG